MDAKRAYELKAVAIERRADLLPALALAQTAQDIRRIIADILGCSENEAYEVELLQLMRFTSETAQTLREAIPDMQD